MDVNHSVHILFLYKSAEIKGRAGNTTIFYNLNKYFLHMTVSRRENNATVQKQALFLF